MMDAWSGQSEIEVPFDLEESSYEPYTCEAGSTILEDRYVDVTLRPFVLDRTSLILDSLHPEIAPHIVITAPPDSWEGSLARAWNSPLPQMGTY
ncbi:hypothetical protein BC629DRAFT_210232 [Irpex lacteus]|nr:hypothetical protein BC629DRAFT_210232 [Irpex lacteus]